MFSKALRRNVMPMRRLVFKTNVNVGRRCTTAASDLETRKSHPQIAAWLFGLAGMVAGMVTVGGITRITRSGLSMTSWSITGSLPPMSKEEWAEEFERYKTFPEFASRPNMDVEEFKSIYFWEYSHRMLGRFVGILFVVPFTYFSVRKMIPKRLYGRLGLLFSLGGAQGLVGWWMVKSGLDNGLVKDRLDNNQEVRVSSYRLATHLTMAFTTYVALLWTALDCINPLKIKDFAQSVVLTKNQISRFVGLRRVALLNGGLIFCTAVSGAFVAGNDAGRAYNTFPKMIEADEATPNGAWFPDKEVLTELTPVYRNLFENTATTQMNHRILALTTLTSIWSTYLPWRLSKNKPITPNNLTYKSLPRLAQVGLTAMAHVSAVQVGLGIATLLNYVPTTLAVMHQAGSVLVLTMGTVFVYSLKFVKYLK